MAGPQRAFILGGGQPDISCDIVIRESHTSELEITDNPVETGVVISDHAYMRPLELEIEGEVSDTWLHGYDQRTGRPISERFFSTTASRSASAWDILTGLQRSVQLFSVQTGLKLYQNMILASLTADQDTESSGGLTFRARLREVIRVGTQTVTYPPRLPGKPHRQAAKKVAAGEKKTDPVTDQQKARTLLKQTLDSFSADPTKLLGAVGF